MRIPLLKKSPLAGFVVYDMYLDVQQGYPATNQGVKSRGKSGYNLQLGSTSGSDTADPTWLANGLSFPDGTDYLKMTNPPENFHAATAWTIISVLKKTTNAGTLFKKEFSTGSSSGFVFLFRSSDPYMKFGAYDTSFKNPSGSVPNLPNDTYTVVGGMIDSGYQRIYYNNSLKISGTTTYNKAQVVNTEPIHFCGPNTGECLTGALAYLAILPSAISDSRYLQIYSYLKKLMSQRGITI
jgi:hypothetical protein